MICKIIRKIIIQWVDKINKNKLKQIIHFLDFDYNMSNLNTN